MGAGPLKYVLYAPSKKTGGSEIYRVFPYTTSGSKKNFFLKNSVIFPREYVDEET